MFPRVLLEMTPGVDGLSPLLVLTFRFWGIINCLPGKQAMVYVVAENLDFLHNVLLALVTATCRFCYYIEKPAYSLSCVV